MANVILRYYYYNNKFETAFFATKSGAGSTLRKLTHGEAEVFKLWIQQYNFCIDVYDDGELCCITYEVFKLL